MFVRNYDRLAAAAEENVKEKEYWMNRLAGDLEKCQFPYDHEKMYSNEPEPSEMSTSPFTFTPGVSAGLLKLSKGSAVKLHMILTTAILILLNKYTEKTDIIVGAPIYKQDVEMDFINTVLILRNQVRETSSFKDLLLQVRQAIVEVTENQNYPIEILLEQLGQSSHGTETPLFSVAILQEEIHEKKYLGTIRYDILFTFRDSGEQAAGEVEYDTRLYEEATVRRIIDHLQGLLQELLAQPDSPVAGIEILDEAEKRKLLYDFNDTTVESLEEKTLHDYFTGQAKKTPDSVALVSEELLRDIQVTYGELDRKSNQLARDLRKRGAGPDIIVGLMVEKSQEMMVGILGILKSGAAYMPLELAYPHTRIEYMLKESGTKIVLTYTRDTLPAWLKEKRGPEPVDIFSPAIYSQSDAPIENINTPEDAAYIIYTSGSTGRPKGVMVEHGNVTAYIQAFLREFSMSAADTALQQASYSFDAFVEEVYPVLSRGGKIALCPRYVIMDTQTLAKFIYKHDITFISVSPLLLNEIDKQPGTGSIRLFISGGDLLKKEYIKQLLQSGEKQVYNTYGPTEATVCATYHRCTHEDKANPPIGKPIANYRVAILDDQNRLKPIGVPGELCITGTGVTRGYINNPELNAEKFIFYSDKHNRSYVSYTTYNSKKLYKTGDLARWQPDGSIEFLGRKDNQVSIRGYRIELGEIENLLLKHEAISAALVKAGEAQKGLNKTDAENQRLCAYIVNRRELELTELKEYLSTYLPEYMVPSYFVLLERMPLTPNGKPDLKALEAYLPISGVGTEYIAPATDTEKTIAEIWKEVLQLEKVGIHDNFFDLGGNSMLLLKATNKLREAFTYKGEIPFMVMFQYTTIYSLSEYIQQLENEDTGTDRLAEQAETLNRGKDRMKKLIRGKSNPA